MSPAREVELRIDRLAHGGEAVGRLPDGRACFVMFAAPGDRVRARIVEEKRRYARAELLEVLEPGPSRVAPPCPLFGRCGGCQWQHVSLGEQRAAKQAAVARALGAAVEPIVAVEPPLGYRTRVRMRAGGGRLGYRAWRSNELVDVERCLLLPEPLDAALQALRPALAGPEREVEAQLGAAGSVAARAEGLALPLPAECDVAAPGEPPFVVAAGAFAQANAAANRALRALVAGALAGARRVLELYAGSGNFTRDLAAAGAHVVALESAPGAVALARRNLAPFADRVELREGPVERALGAAGTGYDAVLADPPRAGLDARVPPALAATGARRLVYVSCDPQTLGRDVDRLRALGWRLDRATPVDAWPHTFHVETVAELTYAGRTGANCRATPGGQH